MSRLERLVQVARPGVQLRQLAVHDDEVVLAGGGEVFRLPLEPSGAARHAVLVPMLAALRPLLPVAVAVPRFIGVMADGTTPFTAEPLLPGEPTTLLDPIAAGQLQGALAALAAIPVKLAQQWGLTGQGTVRHGALGPSALLHDPARGVLTGLVGWQPSLGPAGEQWPAGGPHESSPAGHRPAGPATH